MIGIVLAYYVTHLRLLAATMDMIASAANCVSTFWTKPRPEHCDAAGHMHGDHMNELTRDRDITINVGFGNITFGRDAAGAFAHAVADIEVDFDGSDAREAHLEIDLRVPCRPDSETVNDIVERTRAQIVDVLRSTLQRIEAESVESLLYGGSTGAHPDV